MSLLGVRPIVIRSGNEAPGFLARVDLEIHVLPDREVLAVGQGLLDGLRRLVLVLIERQGGGPAVGAVVDRAIADEHGRCGGGQELLPPELQQVPVVRRCVHGGTLSPRVGVAASGFPLVESLGLTGPDGTG